MKSRKKIIRPVLSLVLLSLLVGQNVFALSPPLEPAKEDNMAAKLDKLKSQTIPVGKVEKEVKSFKIKDVDLPSYHCMNVSYILVSDLKQIGANISWDGAKGKTIIYDLNQAMADQPVFEPLEENAIGYLARDAVYINHQEIPAIYVGQKALIPAKWLTILLENDNNPLASPLQIAIEEKENQDISQLSQLDNVDLVDIEGLNINKTSAAGINIWFDGEDYIEHSWDFSQIKPGEFAYYQDKRYNSEPDYSYVGFVMTMTQGMANKDADFHKAWLKNPSYHTMPQAIPQELLNSLFPNTRVKGKMRSAAGGFAKGEEVDVFNASSNRAYHLLNKKGQLVTVPWASVSIQQSPVTKEEATKEQIESYINSKDFTSKTNYFVWTDIYRQRTYVFKGSKNKWDLFKTMISTTGKDTTPTPTGRYTLNVKVPSFGVNKGYMAKNAYGFIGTTYLYHSVIYDKTGSYLLNGWGSLGNKGSSGCIRLSPEDSAWFYQTMPVGTSIFIN